MAPPTPIEVDPPAVERYPFGLLSVARIVTDPDSHWEMSGVTYAADACSAGGAVWVDVCEEPIPDLQITAYVVTFTKALGVDTLVATLTSRDAAYGTNPVFATVDGVTKALATVGATQSWAVTASSTVSLIAGIAANGIYPQCDAADSMAIPATGVAATPKVLSCVVSVPAPEPVKTIPSGLDVVEGRPFIVYDGVSCVSYQVDEAQDRARRRFDLHEQTLVESRFTAKHLHGAGVVTLGGGAVKLLRGLGLLEDALAERHGGIGIVHAARELGAVFTNFMAVRHDGTRVRTPLDNLWAFGSGYTTAGPTGTAAPAGQAWIYATGPVLVRRSDVQVYEQFDTRKNTRLAIAERSYVITDDCPRLAVLVEIPEV